MVPPYRALPEGQKRNLAERKPKFYLVKMIGLTDDSVSIFTKPIHWEVRTMLGAKRIALKITHYRPALNALL
jgi:hypothetical protein